MPNNFHQLTVTLLLSICSINSLRAIPQEKWDELISQVSQGQSLDEATKIAQELTNSTDLEEKGKGLYLFLKLTEKGLALDKALSAAKETFQLMLDDQTENPTLRMTCLSLFDSLFKNGKGVNEAIKTVQAASTSSHKNVMKSGLMLLRSLVDNGKALNEALKIAHDALKAANDATTTLQLLYLLKSLVNNDYAFEDAEKIAQDATNSQDIKLKKAGLELFFNLVEKDLAFDNAAKAAKKALTSVDRGERWTGNYLYAALIKKSHDLDDAKKTIEKALKVETEESVKEALRARLDEIAKSKKTSSEKFHTLPVKPGAQLLK